MVEYIDVTKRYQRDAPPVVEGVSLSVERGRICVLLGASGSGKTTLLRMANRLVLPDAGTVLVDGVDVATTDPIRLRRSIGYVIQGVGLLPHWSVGRNVATTLELEGRSREERRERVDRLLELVRLDPVVYRDRYPSELSGGEAQRVGVARALAADPPLLLMDEPFGAIDPINRGAIRREFRELQRSLGTTVIFVSHDIGEALEIADTIALLHEGRLVQHGPPVELVAHPSTDYVREFLGTAEDRLLDLLTLHHAIDPAPAANAESDLPALAIDLPLRAAVTELLLHRTDDLQVVSDGAVVGRASLASIREALARTIGEGG